MSKSRYNWRDDPQEGELKERAGHPAYYRVPLRVVPEDECRLHGQGNQVEDCQGCLDNFELDWETREMRSAW